MDWGFRVALSGCWAGRVRHERGLLRVWACECVCEFVVVCEGKAKLATGQRTVRTNHPTLANVTVLGKKWGTNHPTPASVTVLGKACCCTTRHGLARRHTGTKVAAATGAWWTTENWPLLTPHVGGCLGLRCGLSCSEAMSASLGGVGAPREASCRGLKQEAEQLSGTWPGLED
jgi:hypothetical protein